MKKFNGSIKTAIVAATLGVAGIAGLGAAAIAAEAQGRPGQMAADTEEDEGAEDAREAQMLAQARVSAGAAAQTAQQHTGLKVAEVEIDDEATTPTWEVSVGSGANERTVSVDAMSGQVKSVAADDGDDSEGSERAD